MQILSAIVTVISLDVLQWSDDLLPNMLKNPQIPEPETHRELKEQLYYLMVDYFDKGKVSQIHLHCWNVNVMFKTEWRHTHTTHTINCSAILAGVNEVLSCLSTQTV